MAQDLNDPKTSQYHDLILFTAVVCVVTRHASRKAFPSKEERCVTKVMLQQTIRFGDF